MFGRLWVLGSLLLLAVTGCFSSSDDGGGGGEPTKLYLGTAVDGEGRIHTIVKDDAGNYLVGLGEDPLNPMSLNRVFLHLSSGEEVTFLLDSQGRVTSAENDDMLISYNHINGVDNTFDIMVWDASGEIIGDFKAVPYDSMPEMQADVNTLVQRDEWQALKMLYLTVKVGTCPASILLAGTGFGLAFTAASCSLAAKGIYEACNKPGDLVEAAQPVSTVPSQCQGELDDDKAWDCAGAMARSLDTSALYVDQNGQVQDGTGPVLDPNGGNSGVLVGSCVQQNMVCLNYWGSDFTDTNAAGACEGTYVSGVECVTSGSIGLCVMSEGTGMELEMVFYGPMPVETAKMMCSQTGGSWK